ncbi:HAMP domain-containing sensor histidine kinase [Williamsia sterculiae]|nr:HAMP domain-containing sensor histidine kinase [Williamsia sterculiae]
MTLILVALGLTVSGVSVTTAMQNQLVERTDNGLRQAADGWARPRDTPPPTNFDEAGPRRPPSPYYVMLIRSDGSSFEINDPGGRPKVDVDSLGSRPTTVGSADGSDTQWRVVKVGSSSGTSIVAVKLNDVRDTVERLTWLLLGVGLGVLVVIGVLGYLLVRTSLRGLTRVESTAHAIAGGDLTRRVPEGPPNTEVGRLAASLNVMLHQIQNAFAATAASEEEARRSEDRMRRFVADASHELRTPLTSIKGFSELYQQGAIPDGHQAMARIQTEANRMGLLVEDLLMLARLDAQRPLERAHVDLLSLAADAVHAAKATAPQRVVDLEVVDGPGVPTVIGDAARLSQVIGNLITNALRHTPDAAEITVRVGTIGDWALLAVADTGPGLSPEDRDRVFERFYRADSSRHRSSTNGGSGLGLSIVSALVAAHDGQVGVDSEPGKGATFWVRLPRVE